MNVPVLSAQLTDVEKHCIRWRCWYLGHSIAEQVLATASW